MRTDRVGIYTPYGWDEATYAAVRIAELARQQGQVPSLRAYGPCFAKDYVFHADWDDAVVWSSKGLKDWIARQRVIIWFDLHKDLLNYAKKQGVKNVLVPLLHRLEQHTLRGLKLFDSIYCPTKTTEDVLGAAGLRNIVYVRWDAGLPYTKKTTLYEITQDRLLVLPEWPITNEWGLALAYTIRALVDAKPDLDVTVLQLKQWPKVVNRAWLDLTDKHGLKVNMLRSPTYHSLLHAYRVHDWVLYLPEKVNIGVRLAEAFSQGLPIVALDMPTVRNFVKHDFSAHLIPCEYTSDSLGRATALLNTHNILQATNEVIGDRENWYALSGDREAACEIQRKHFETMWATVLSPF